MEVEKEIFYLLVKTQTAIAVKDRIAANFDKIEYMVRYNEIYIEKRHCEKYTETRK